jgi:hypothetical protein
VVQVLSEVAAKSAENLPAAHRSQLEALQFWTCQTV